MSKHSPVGRQLLTLWEADFCTNRMWTLRGPVDLYLLVFLHPGTRRNWIGLVAAGMRRRRLAA